MIILNKTSKNKELLKGIADIIVAAKVTQALNFINLARRYKWAISNTNLDKANKLKLTSIKKY